MVYDKKKLESYYVKMQITPVPKCIQEATNPQDMFKFLAIHPKFHNTGNNFVVIVDQNNIVSVCKARFDIC